MPAGGQVGYGVSVTFQSGLMAMITSVKLSGFKRPSIKVSYSNMTNAWDLFVGGKIADPGELSVELLFDNEGDFKTAILAAAETVTVSWPLPQAGGTTKGTWACSGFMTELEAGAPIEDKMTATAKLKLSGIPTMTAHS